MGELALVGDHSTVPLTRISCNTVFSKSQNACKVGTLCTRSHVWNYNLSCLMIFDENVAWMLLCVFFASSFTFRFIMQLFRVHATMIFCIRNYEKKPSKVAQIGPFFSVLQLDQMLPKFQFMFHKNCSLRDLYIMTLDAKMVSCLTSSKNLWRYLPCKFKSVLSISREVLV